VEFNAIDLPDYLNTIEIKPISDIHLGAPECDMELVKSEIDWLQQKENRFAILNGDIMNIATERSLSNTYNSNLTPHEELKKARKLFEPVKDKILAVNEGNHERRISRDTGIDIAEELATSLDTFYHPGSIITKIRFGSRDSNQKKQVYTIFQTHGFSGARTTGGKANRLEKLRKIAVTDIYIVSHTHQKINFKKKIFQPDLRNNKVTEKLQTFINTGAYLDYGGYGERKAYDPTEKGTYVLRLHAAEKKVEVIA